MQNLVAAGSLPTLNDKQWDWDQEMAACTIIIEAISEGRFRATCHLLPDVEAVADSEEAARQEIDAAIEEYLTQMDPSPRVSEGLL